MESSNTSPVDDSPDSNNFDTEIHDLAVAKFEDCNAELVTSQSEDEQMNEQIFQCEGATIYLDPQGLNSHRVFVTKNDDGNDVILLMTGDPNDPSLEQDFTHASVLHTDAVSIEFETGEVPQEHTRHLYIGNSDGIIDIKGENEEVPQEQERHVYTENSDGVISVKSEIQCSINSGVESPLWSVSNNGQQKSNSTEMLFIPNPTVVNSSALMLAPEETKLPKLMQLARIAHKLQQNNGGSDTDITAEDADSPLNDIETPVIIVQDSLEKDPGTDSETTQTRDNAVSVIHITSELPNNHTKLDVSYEIPSPGNYSTPHEEEELPADVLSSNASRDSLQESPGLKLIEEDSSSKDLGADGISIPDEVAQSNVISHPLSNTELDLSEDNSPETFQEQYPKLDDTLVIENNSIDDDSHAGLCLLVEEDESKDDGITSHDRGETVKETDAATSYKNEQSNIQVPSGSDSVCVSKVDIVDCSKLSVSEKNGFSSLTTKYSVFSHKSKTKTSSTVGSSAQYSSTGVGKISKALSQYEFSESEEVCFKDADSRRESNHKSKQLSSQPYSLAKNSNTDFVIAENVKDCETNPDISETYYLPCPSQNLIVEETAEAESVSVFSDRQSSPPRKILSENETCENSTSLNSQNINSRVPLIQNSVDSSLSPTFSTSKENEDNEETFVKPPKKTYIRKKNHTPCHSGSSLDSVKNGIELFSLDHLNFSECDREIEEAKTSVNKDQYELTSDITAKDTNPEDELSQLSNSEPGPSKENNIEAPSSLENTTAADDLFSIKVSATYNRRKKPKQEVKSPSSKQERSLRTRSSAFKRPLGNGTVDDHNSEPHKNSFDSSGSENIPWGDLLLGTSFKPSATSDAPSTSQTLTCDAPSTSQTITCNTSTLLDVPSTLQVASNGSPTSSLVHITSTPISEQQRRRTNKFTRDFDRLLHSPKSKAASHKKVSSSKKFILDIKKKNTKGKTKLNSPSNKSDAASGSSSSNRENSKNISRLRAKRARCQDSVNQESVKKAYIQYLKQATVSRPGPPRREQVQEFNCSNCNFTSSLVNNLMEHLKYCPNRQPPINYTAEDMNKRQRIRGEDTEFKNNPKKLQDFITGSLHEIREDLNEGECSGLSQNHPDSDEETDMDFNDKKSEFGYGEDDVVWARVEDRFWPGLVCKLNKRMASIKLINYPTEMKGLKISAERVHTFDDAKWNKMLLAEAETLPNNEIFVRAVQTSETFVRKKWLGLNVKGKDFFSIPDKVDFVTDNESSDSNINEEDDSDFDMEDLGLASAIPPHRKARYDKLDLDRLREYILEGHVDEHVLDIYNRKQSSIRHQKYFSGGKDDCLGQRSWFGPFENKAEQGILLNHFRSLYLQQIGQQYSYFSYILQVWIPEAVVKAIAVTENIPLKEAEDIFESDDSMDSEDDCGDSRTPEMQRMHS